MFRFIFVTWMCDISHIADVKKTSHNEHFLLPSISTTYWSLGNVDINSNVSSSLSFLFLLLLLDIEADFEVEILSLLLLLLLLFVSGAIELVLLSSDELCVERDAVFVSNHNKTKQDTHKNFKNCTNHTMNKTFKEN